MRLNAASFLSAPAALAASLGQLDVRNNHHKTIAAIHHEIESRSMAAIVEKHSHFTVSSSWVPPCRQDAPDCARQYLGGKEEFDELSRMEPRYAVIYVAALICKVSRGRELQNEDVATITKQPNPFLPDICRWYAPTDANRLVDAVRNYVEERAEQQVRLRSNWSRAMVEFFPMMSEESTVLGRLNGQGFPQKIPPERIPYMAFRDRVSPDGEREAIVVFEDGSNDILTKAKIRRAPSQSAPQSAVPAVPDYAETHTGLPGRPSAKALVMAEFGKRVAAGVICKTLKAEAEVLETVAANLLRPEDAKPKARSIETMIRQDYRQAKHA